MTLREWREDHGIKLIAVAKHLGIARQTYAAYEANQADMSVDMALKACEFMHAPFDLIFLPQEVSTSDISQRQHYPLSQERTAP